jgi:formate hydrogenlyase subunit 3/multisubunit Na+/H+ antiporter MnhD subunit
LSPWLVPALLGGLAMALSSAALSRRAKLVPPLLLLVTAAGISVALVESLATNRPSARLVEGGLGTLSLARLPLGVLVGGWGALVLELGVAHRPRLSGSTIASGLVIGVASSWALLVTGVVPLALLLAFMCAFVWGRWQRIAGPLLPIRSLGRQAALLLCALLAGAAVLPSQRIGAAPAALAGMLLVGGLGGVAGLLPLSSWVGAVSKVTPAEAATWRIWFIPVGIVALTRLLVTGPSPLTQVMQLLLVALGLATAIFWGCAGYRADPTTRYWRVLQADVGFMCVGIGSGDVQGLAAALLLIVVHWLAGAALSEPRGARSHLLAWVGLSGVPPFGGFTGRLLAVVGVTFMGPVVVALLLVAFGLQVAACGAGVREAVLRATVRGPRLSELVGLVAALGALVLGLVAGPFLQVAFGVHV